MTHRRLRRVSRRPLPRGGLRWSTSATSSESTVTSTRSRPPSGRTCACPRAFYADEALVAQATGDRSLEQLVNTATLPGVVAPRARHARHAPGLRVPDRRRGRHRVARRGHLPGRGGLRHQLRGAPAREPARVRRGRTAPRRARHGALRQLPERCGPGRARAAQARGYGRGPGDRRALGDPPGVRLRGRSRAHRGGRLPARGRCRHGQRPGARTRPRPGRDPRGRQPLHRGGPGRPGAGRGRRPAFRPLRRPGRGADPLRLARAGPPGLHRLRRLVPERGAQPTGSTCRTASWSARR